MRLFTDSYKFSFYSNFRCVLISILILFVGLPLNAQIRPRTEIEPKPRGSLIRNADRYNVVRDSVNVISPAERPVTVYDPTQNTSVKMALLIGNSKYFGSNALSSPMADIKVMHSTLDELGYEVTVVRNCTRKKMREAFLSFYENSKKAHTTLFYYAGHTIKYEGDNYLVPVDAELNYEDDIFKQTVNLDAYIGFLDPSKENIITIDACYDSQFPFNLEMGKEDPCFEAPEGVPFNSFVTFTAASNYGAYLYSPEKPKNSFFTEIFKQEVKKGESKFKTMVEIQKRLKKESRGKQGITLFGSVTKGSDWKNNSIPIQIFNTIYAFPWPPPKVSAKYVIPASVFENCQTFKDVDDLLINALDNTGYFDKSYFGINADDISGFALVTRLEQINSDGSSKNKKVWGMENQGFDFGEYLWSLFFPHTGYFRVIVFVVVDQPVAPGETEASASTAMGWLSSGLSTLDSDMKSKAYTSDHAVTALIYEYKLPETEVNAVLTIPGDHQGRDHLERSNIWNALTN